MFLLFRLLILTWISESELGHINSTPLFCANSFWHAWVWIVPFHSCIDVSLCVWYQMKEEKMLLIMKHIVGFNIAWQRRYLTDKTGFLFCGTHGYRLICPWAKCFICWCFLRLFPTGTSWSLYKVNGICSKLCFTTLCNIYFLLVHWSKSKVVYGMLMILLLHLNVRKVFRKALKKMYYLWHFDQYSMVVNGQVSK